MFSGTKIGRPAFRTMTATALPDSTKPGPNASPVCDPLIDRHHHKTRLQVNLTGFHS
jgi:hypothetical protein